MKRILLDQGLAPHAAVILRQHGLDAVHVSEIGMEQAEDIQIMEKARIDERVCVTLDHDFHAHLAVTGHGRPSVVLVRVQGLDAQGQADLATKEPDHSTGLLHRFLPHDPSRRRGSTY